MRLSWYANSKVAVFSIWQGNRCTGTFRLPFADLTRMVQALQAGPPEAVPAGPPGGSGYQDRDGYQDHDGYQDRDFGQDHDFPATASYGQPMPADTTAYLPSQEYADPGYQEPQYQKPQYREPDYQDPRYQEPQYQEPQYQEPQHQEPLFQEPQYQESEYGGWSEQDYDNSDPGADQPYGDHPYGQRGYQDEYLADPGYGRVGRHSASPDDTSHDGVRSSDSVPPSTRANYAMPDYDPPAIASLRPVSSPMTMAMATRPAPSPRAPSRISCNPSVLGQTPAGQKSQASLTRCGQRMPNRCPTPP